MAKDIRVYSTSTCPWCRRVKKFLEDNSIAFQELNVGIDSGAREAMVKKSGQLGVPVIEIDGEIVIGFDEPRLREKLSLSKTL